MGRVGVCDLFPKRATLRVLLQFLLYQAQPRGPFPYVGKGATEKTNERNIWEEGNRKGLFLQHLAGALYHLGRGGWKRTGKQLVSRLLHCSSVRQCIVKSSDKDTLAPVLPLAALWLRYAQKKGTARSFKSVEPAAETMIKPERVKKKHPPTAL